MLANQFFIIVSSNQWSKILTRTFHLNLIHGKYNVFKVPIRKNRIKKVSMSEENNKSNVVGTPSTSGSTDWECVYNPLENSNALSQDRQTRFGINGYNLVIMNQVLAAQGVTTNADGMNYCLTNFNFYNEMSRQECLSRRYYHSHEQEERNDPVRRRSVGRRSDKDLSSRRVWEKTNKKINNKPGFIFTLMSYNVLAQDLLFQHPHLYQYHNQNFLDWNSRWNNLFKEIQKFSPDILCLQEVQESHIKEYFSLLETLGYRSLYKKRTGMRTEGCAMYYKTDIINLVEYTAVEFYQPNVVLLNRDNVAIVAKFTPKLHPTREFVIATTHLLYNPKRQDVRLAQMQVLLSEVERISYNQKSKDGEKYVPVIITGDLNSTPDSALYEFITKGKLNYAMLSPRHPKDSNSFTGKALVPPELRITDNCQHADIMKKRLKNEKTTRSEELAMIELANSGVQTTKTPKNVEDDSELFGTGTLSHTFAFRSVYDDRDMNNSIGTTFQDEWLTVDYIFYSGKKGELDTVESKLKLLSRYRLPTKEELRDITIPNSVLGSDHLSLLAKFKLEY